MRNCFVILIVSFYEVEFIIHSIELVLDMVRLVRLITNQM